MSVKSLANSLLIARWVISFITPERVAMCTPFPIFEYILNVRDLTHLWISKDNFTVWFQKVAWSLSCGGFVLSLSTRGFGSSWNKCKYYPLVKIMKNDMVGFGQLWSTGQIQPAICLCVSQKLKMFLLLLFILFTFKMFEKIQTGMVFCNVKCTQNSDISIHM